MINKIFLKFLKCYPYLIFLLVTTLFVSENLLAQVEFIENKGQWDSKVKFMSSAGSGSFFLTDKGFAITQYNADDVENIKIKMHEATSSNATAKREKWGDSVRTDAYSVQFLNSQTPVILADKELPSVTNYFIGNDKSKWASNCKSYLGVTYKNIYPNIDLRYYTDATGNLKYDFIINPGAKIEDIAMKYKGAQKLSIKNRELNITTSLGVNKELKPYTYQVIDNQKQELDCRYVIKGDVVKFKVKNYSPDKTLIIDPTLIFFSYSGSRADNWGFTATYGKDGSFYGGGIAFGENFSPGAKGYDESFNGGNFDIAIIKLTPDGRKRIYATYIGGNGKDQPHSLIEDPHGNLIIAGRSNSTDYPVTAKAGSGGKFDIVVTKLNATGSGIIGSMKIGGSGDDGVNIATDESNILQSLKRNYGDDARSEVLLDASNNIYVASCSSSDGNPGTKGAFPTTPGAFQTKLKGKQDAVVLKLNPNCNSLLFSTFLGGSDNDAAYVLTIGNNGNVYVAGGTASPDFFANIPTVNVIKSTNAALGSAGGKDPCDGFVVELNSSGTNAIRGTYIGTDKADQIYGIETDKFGFVYVMGTSEGNMKVIDPPNAKAYFNLSGKQFISKLKPDLSAFVYSTVFGSPNSQVPNISPTAFLVDRCQNVYVSGWGGKANGGFSSGNTKGLPVTADAVKPRTDASGSDFYFIVLRKNVDSLLYGSFFGQEDPPGQVTFGDHVDGGTSRFNSNGVIYQAICANCYNNVAFPGTPGSWAKANGAPAGRQSAGCNLGMLKIEMDFSGVRSGLHTSINGVSNDTSGCVPLQVDFTDTLKKGKLYYWYFGDGTGDTTRVPATSHIYENVGRYPVMLVTIDSATCNISDTSYKTIRAGDNKINLDFISQKLEPCTNLSYNFTNISTATRGSFRPGLFMWDFGDNSPLFTQSQNPVNHAFAGPGTYKVTLSTDDTTYCNSPADTIKTIRLSPQVKASFSTPPNGCVPYDAVFINNSLGGINFLWDFGDGTTSTDDSPTHLYTKVGPYTVKLTAYDSSSCNKIDDSSFTITVSPIPIASFTFNPLQPKENTYTNFVNQSIGATHYTWNFGDGDTSTLENPTHIYNITDTYQVCLNAANDVGCSADTCVDVRALVRPLVDVPSAFTPGKFGANAIIRVVGFGIKDMNWAIYNRWGQKVYESNSLKGGGWDGTFNGKLQPMDVYTYTLGVIFSSGQKVTKTGDITLLR